MDLAELFPAGDYRLHLTLRRGRPEDFFGPRDLTGRVIAERRHWISSDPERYVALRAEGRPLLEEFLELASAWPGAQRDGPVAEATMAEAGGRFEPDLLLLAPDSTGHFLLQGGALCFPTGWALGEKIGQTLEEIHAVVPGLNPALAAPIGQFLAKMKPGVAFLRDNWGLAASAELNLHPSRRIAAPMPPSELSRLWLRVERQALVALPRSGGVAFGIGIELHRLDGLAGTPVGESLAQALTTMPADLAAYKRIAEVRGEVAALLTSSGH